MIVSLVSYSLSVIPTLSPAAGLRCHVRRTCPRRSSSPNASRRSTQAQAQVVTYEVHACDIPSYTVFSFRHRSFTMTRIVLLIAIYFCQTCHLRRRPPCASSSGEIQWRHRRVPVGEAHSFSNATLFKLLPYMPSRLVLYLLFCLLMFLLYVTSCATMGNCHGEGVREGAI